MLALGVAHRAPRPSVPNRLVASSLACVADSTSARHVLMLMLMLMSALASASASVGLRGYARDFVSLACKALMLMLLLMLFL